VSWHGCLTCGTRRHVSENHPKQPTNPPRGIKCPVCKVCGCSIHGFAVGGWNLDCTYR
jgi:hypothetical protein